MMGFIQFKSLWVEIIRKPPTIFYKKLRILPIFVNMTLDVKKMMESCSTKFTPIYTVFLVLDFLLDQNFFLKNSFFVQKTPFLNVFKTLQKTHRTSHILKNKKFSRPPKIYS